MFRSKTKPPEFLPFPISSLGMGSIAIPEDNTVNTNYSYVYNHHLDRLVSGSLSSLYTTATGRGRRKTKCDDAFAVHFRENYPVVFIADGGFNSCLAEHIQQISVDPHIKELILEFQASLNSEMQHDTIAKAAKELVQNIVDFCAQNYTYVPFGEAFPKPSEFTFSLAIPFLGENGAKIVTFGIGNDEIFLKRNNGEIDHLRNIKHYYPIDDAGNLALAEGHENCQLLDKVLVPPRTKYYRQVFKSALNLMEVKVNSFEEDDELFVTTDGFSKIINDYHDAIKKLIELPEESKEEKLLGGDPVFEKILSNQPIDVKEIIALDAKQIQDVLSTLHRETCTIDQRYYTANAPKLRESEEQLALNIDQWKQLITLKRKEQSTIQPSDTRYEKLKNEIQDLNQKIEENEKLHFHLKQKIIYQRGDDGAFVKVLLSKPKWSNRLRWRFVATPQTLFDIINDSEYWKSKTWSGKVPSGVTTLQASFKGFTEDNLQEMSVLALQKQYTYLSYHITSRQSETQYLYDLVSSQNTNMHLNKKFQKLYIDWVKHHGPERMALHKVQEPELKSNGDDKKRNSFVRFTR